MNLRQQQLQHQTRRQFLRNVGQFSLGAIALSEYLSHKAMNAAFGDGGAVVMLLLWVNYSAQIILYGAEFTHTFSRARSKQIAERSLPKNPFMP